MGPLTITQAALKAGQCFASDLFEQCLSRIEARETQVQVWFIWIETAPGWRRKRLVKGIGWVRCTVFPVGLKDIFDVRDMPTQAGIPAYKGRIAVNDANSVASLRAAGAIILGKTMITAYAMA